MQEASMTKCKKCEILLVRIQDGKYANGKDKRWVDENGKQWNGRVCPTCNVTRAGKSMKSLRNGERDCTL